MLKANRMQRLEIKEVLLLTMPRFTDERGYFVEVYNKHLFESFEIEEEFVQDNESFSLNKNTVRGLHCQFPPYAQGKLVRVIEGSIFDVAVDVRVGSPTFGQHVAVELSSHEEKMLYIPPGFLHGFMTLEAKTRVHYKVTHFYSKECDAGVAFDDPDLKIRWPLPIKESILSAKDRALPRLKDFQSPFNYEGVLDE